MFADIFSTDRRYSVIYADPPWKQSKGGKKKVRANSSGKPLDYPVISLNEIKSHYAAAAEGGMTMALFDDYEVEAQFAQDFPFGVPCDVWQAKEGAIKVSEMTDRHIANCMRIVGEDDPWYLVFAKELKRRNHNGKMQIPGRCDH